MNERTKEGTSERAKKNPTLQVIALPCTCTLVKFFGAAAAAAAATATAAAAAREKLGRREVRRKKKSTFLTFSTFLQVFDVFGRF